MFHGRLAQQRAQQAAEAVGRRRDGAGAGQAHVVHREQRAVNDAGDVVGADRADCTRHRGWAADGVGGWRLRCHLHA